jgi:hypothetical protein
MSPSDEPVAGAGTPPEPSDQAHFRRTLVRVMAVQFIALIALGLLQYLYDL